MTVRRFLLVTLLCSLASCEMGPSSPSPSSSPADASRGLGSMPASTLRMAGNPLGLEEGDDCSRSPGFWCQNNDGDNPNLTRDEFLLYATGAIALLNAEGVTDLTSTDDIESAVCDNRRQLLRHLVTLALNLAAGLRSDTDPLVGENPPLATVGDAFSLGAATYLLGDAVPVDERNAIKDVLDRINNNENVASTCVPEEDDEDDGDADEGEDEDGETDDGEVQQTTCALDPDGKITICHVPPGNNAASSTIRVSPSAWKAHEAHGDACGACT